MMLPPLPPARMRRATSVATRKAPLRLTSTTASKSSSVWSSNALEIEMPELLTSTSMRPSACSIASTAPFTDALSATSSLATAAVPPACANFRRDRLERLGSSRRQAHLRALSCEHLREVPPETAGGSRDQHYFAAHRKQVGRRHAGCCSEETGADCSKRCLRKTRLAGPPRLGPGCRPWPVSRPFRVQIGQFGALSRPARPLVLTPRTPLARIAAPAFRDRLPFAGNGRWKGSSAG